MMPPTNYPVGIAGAVVFLVIGLTLAFRPHAVQRWGIRQLEMSARTKRARKLLPTQFVKSEGYVVMLRIIGVFSLATGLFIAVALLAASA